MAVEWFVSLVKPDGIEKGLVGDILHRFEKRGLTLLDLKWMRLTEKQIRDFYADKATEPFFPELLTFLLSGPVVASLWSAEEAIAKGRQVIGEKDPLKSEAGTIRGSMAGDRIHSLVHGSRTPTEAYNEALILWPERFEGTAVPAADRPAADAPKEMPAEPKTERAWSWSGEQEPELERAW